MMPLSTNLTMMMRLVPSFWLLKYLLTYLLTAYYLVRRCLRHAMPLAAPARPWAAIYQTQSVRDQSTSEPKLKHTKLTEQNRA